MLDVPEVNLSSLFSAAIRDYERKVIGQSVPTKTSSNKNNSKISPRTATFAAWSSLQHPHLLLQFFDDLEKLVYNAYEGTAVSISPQHKVHC